MTVFVSKHARKRIRKRLGLNSKAVQKLASEAYERGFRHTELAGPLSRYLNKISIQQGSPTIRVYNSYLFLFLFANESLITVWLLPNKYKKDIPTCTTKGADVKTSAPAPGSGW